MNADDFTKKQKSIIGIIVSLILIIVSLIIIYFNKDNKEMSVTLMVIVLLMMIGAICGIVMVFIANKEYINEHFE